MLNVLIPLGASSQFFESAEFPYSKWLVEFLGKTMVQHAIENLSNLSDSVRFIFVLREQDCFSFHLDSIIRLLCNDKCEITILQHDTQGAACSALLAIDYIAGNTPLVVANVDQLFDCNLSEYLNRFQQAKADAGCLYFESVHPRWSYIRLENEDTIVEAAEKRPLSRHSIAGFYYFATGDIFIEGAKASIRKDASIDGKYYISPILNELILLNCMLKAYPVSNAVYHTFYQPQKIEEYVTWKNQQS